MKLFTTFLGLILILSSFTNYQKPIRVSINQNVETIGICFGLAKNGFSAFPANYYEPFRIKAQQHFILYKEHQAVKMVEDFVAIGFWLDKLLNLALHMSEMPSAEIAHQLDDDFYQSASKKKDVEEGKKNIKLFIQALNNFYQKANVHEFISDNQSYYQEVLKEVRKNLPSQAFIPTMEQYYGKKHASYTLIPSPVMYRSAAVGPRVKTAKGLEVFNIFGPVILTEDSSMFKYGYDDAQKIHELSVHEFGHSFVNPILDSPKNEMVVAKYDYLFKPIKEKMNKQGYGNWKTCVIEHIVRLGEIRVAYAMNASETAERLRKDYVEQRKFMYIPVLEESIKTYEGQRKEYSSFEEYVPILLEALSKIDTTTINESFR